MHSRSCPPRDKNYSSLDFFLAASLLLALFASCVPWSPADSILRRFDAAGSNQSFFSIFYSRYDPNQSIKHSIDENSECSLLNRSQLDEICPFVESNRSSSLTIDYDRQREVLVLQSSATRSRGTSLDSPKRILCVLSFRFCHQSFS